EIVDGEDARRDHIAARWLLRAEVAKPDHGGEKDKQELPEQGPGIRPSYPRRIEPRQEGENDDRAGERSDADQLARDRAQDGVERQVVPFRHDMGRRLAWVGHDVVVGMGGIAWGGR